MSFCQGCYDVSEYLSSTEQGDLLGADPQGNWRKYDKNQSVRMGADGTEEINEWEITSQLHEGILDRVVDQLGITLQVELLKNPHAIGTDSVGADTEDIPDLFQPLP